MRSVSHYRKQKPVVKIVRNVEFIENEPTGKYVLEPRIWGPLYSPLWGPLWGLNLGSFLGSDLGPDLQFCPEAHHFFEISKKQSRT